jgi:hypothetical protein
MELTDMISSGPETIWKSFKMKPDGASPLSSFPCCKSTSEVTVGSESAEAMICKIDILCRVFFCGNRGLERREASRKVASLDFRSYACPSKGSVPVLKPATLPIANTVPRYRVEGWRGNAFKKSWIIGTTYSI